MPYTCKCGTGFDLVAALDAQPADHVGSEGAFFHRCAGCGEGIEGRLRSGRVELGYSYWAGSMHFEAMCEIRFRDLKVTASDPDDLDVVLGERRWHFGIRHVGRKRMIVLSQAFAAGKRLGELDFAQWNVTLEQVERGTERVNPAAELVIAAGDFLTVTGPGPALIHVWQYLNNGRPKGR